MDLIKAPEPFYSEIRQMAVNLTVNEKAIRAYLQDRRNGTGGFKHKDGVIQQGEHV